MAAQDHLGPQFREHMLVSPHGYSPDEVNGWSDKSAEIMHKMAHKATFDEPDHSHDAD